MTTDELLPWLFARTSGGVRWGLERTEELLAGVGDPHRHFRAVHIGGTNGKGSVAALCDAALRAADGAPVGLYTSPHLVRFNERIRIDGVPLSDRVLVEAAERLRPAIERTSATFFEATTALAFLCFAEAGVRTAVVEVGLGGRLDSTNVITPLVTAVTNVALDHGDYLGTTIAEIAREKGGIFKSGVPAITAAEGEALAALRRAAASADAPLHEVEDRVELRGVETLRADGGTMRSRFTIRSHAWGERQLEIGLAGPHQLQNAMLAAETLGLLPADARPAWDAVAAGFSTARWPGRLQVERIAGTTWVFDVAHNPAGARALANALPALKLPPPLVLVAGILRDKEWQEMLPPLLELADAVILTAPGSAPRDRVWDAAEVSAWLTDHATQPVRVIESLPAALQRATTLAPHGTVLVTGSFHTVGDAMAELGTSSV